MRLRETIWRSVHVAFIHDPARGRSLCGARLCRRAVVLAGGERQRPSRDHQGVVRRRRGQGELRFGRRTYPLSIGGVSIGFSGGVSQANLVGTVSNIRRASDVAGTYSATTAGAALITGGKQVVTLRNEKGAVLQLRGSQVGVEINLDVSGMVIGFR
jgi:hypothetical protein